MAYNGRQYLLEELPLAYNDRRYLLEDVRGGLHTVHPEDITDIVEWTTINPQRVQCAGQRLRARYAPSWTMDVIW